MKSEDLDSESITRCICNKEDNEGLMIQCEDCRVWQHCECVNIPNEKACPPTYYCETCKPELHNYTNKIDSPISSRRSKRNSSATKSISPEDDLPRKRKIKKQSPILKNEEQISPTLMMTNNQIKTEEFTTHEILSDNDLFVNIGTIQIERSVIGELPKPPYEMKEGEYLYPEPNTPPSPKINLINNYADFESNVEANGNVYFSPPSKPKQYHNRTTLKDMKKRVYQINGYLECLSDDDIKSSNDKNGNIRDLITDIKSKLSRFNDFI